MSDKYNNLAFELVDASDVPFEDDMYLLVEYTDWIGVHKGESRDIIFSKESDGLYYRIRQYRSGSDFTDWYYEAEAPVRVEPETVAKIVWNEV